MTKSGRRTSSGYAEFRSGIDLGFAKSISIYGQGVTFDCCVLLNVG